MAQDRARSSVNPPQAGHIIGSSHVFGQNAAPVGGAAAYGLSSGQAISDSISQSRPQYRPGYLLSLAQNENSTAQTNGQRHDETFIIPTRAKINPAFSRTTTTEFGSESMFESASKHRHRETADDEDGPPTTSVSDLVNDVHKDTYSSKPKILPTPTRLNTSHSNLTTLSSSNSPILYVIVFGYPQPRYSLTLSHFEVLAAGGITKPELSNDVENAFKIGFNHPWEAARALRRNGETISGEGGRWMVGVKWADPMAAQQILGASATLASYLSPEDSPGGTEHVHTQMDTEHLDQALVVSTSRDGTSAIGTPISLAPSSSAFRRTDHDVRGHPMQHVPVSQHSTLSKGMFGQVSDLLFGW